VGGRRRKIGLTDREKRLLAAIRGWEDKEVARTAGGVKGGPSVPRYRGSSELFVDRELDEKFKPLRTARKKEAEAKRDERTY